MNEIVLGGCTPTPLASYLKALGVFRLLSARHPGICGFWSSANFVLLTKLDRGTIEHFFLSDYEPTALVTPWNGRGGFLEGDDEGDEESSRAGAQMVRMFATGAVADRFQPLATTLNSIQSMRVVRQLNSARADLKRLNASAKAKGKDNLSDEEKDEISRQGELVRVVKGRLLQELRNNLPDVVLPWLDTCVALATDEHSGEKRPIPAPLLGAGGVDGSMDFGVNFLRRVNDVFEAQTGLPRDSAKEWLSNALFGGVTNSLYSVSRQDRKKVSVGQFSPSDAGGYNANNGFNAEALLNPWNTILQFEGAVLFAASTVRRLEGSGAIYSSLPFTVAPVAIGETVALADEAPKGAKRKAAEIWLPLWGRPATCRELGAVLREGRITLHRSSVTNGFDCVRAVAGFGSSRGIDQFQRFIFLKRSGDAFLALDKGRFNVRESVYGYLVEELESRDRFLSRFRAFARSKTSSGEWKASTKIRIMARHLDALLVRILQKDDKRALRCALVLLGEIQAKLAGSSKARELVSPISRLSEQWVEAADDGSCAFRIARALAGLHGEAGVPLPIRAQVFPIHPLYSMWKDQADKDKKYVGDQFRGVRLYSGMAGTLCHALFELLNRRLWLAERLEMEDRPLQSASGATLEDVDSFLQSDRMDQRIASLVPGLSLCEIPFDTEQADGEGSVPAAFALLKLSLTSNSILHKLDVLTRDKNLSNPGGMLQQLASGHAADRAVLAAWRRLRISSVNPVFDRNALPSLAGISPRRVAAALLIPLRLGAYRRIANGILKTDDSAGNSAA